MPTDTGGDGHPQIRKSSASTPSDEVRTAGNAQAHSELVLKQESEVDASNEPTSPALTVLPDLRPAGGPQETSTTSQIGVSLDSSGLALPETPRFRSRLGIKDPPLWSSSPLSSPPPIIYDPYEEPEDDAPESPTSNRDTSRSTSKEPPSGSTAPFPSQSSLPSNRALLPNMKGRDLFDAQIWSCPIKTSVFYTFISTLRQKVREAQPTKSHYFVSVLRDSRKLVRCYTQNIDQLEERVGLTTSLSLGAGSRYRFSTRAGRGTRASKGSEVAADESQLQSQKEEDTNDSQVLKEGQTSQPSPKLEQDDGAKSLPTASQSLESGTDADGATSKSSSSLTSASVSAPPGPNRGVECVFLHGSLAELRCFVCARTASWDEESRMADTLAGRQPTCPHCEGATAAREEKGKRALGVGKLRPDIVLYGEEHPHAHLIHPLVKHDLSLGPDMLLILGTSMRVHGLKVLVREFARAVHDRGGKVVFVNFTKPPESVWSDVIDYWVQWDCDAWVEDLQKRKPALWLPPGSTLPDEDKPKASKASRRQSGEGSKRKEASAKTYHKNKESDQPLDTQTLETSATSIDGEASPLTELETQPTPSSQLTPQNSSPKKSQKTRREQKFNPDAKRPACIRDHKQNGAYLVWKIMQDLRRITGDNEASPSPAASVSPLASAEEPAARSKPKRARKSTPSSLESNIDVNGYTVNQETASQPSQLPAEPNVAPSIPSPKPNGLQTAPKEPAAPDINSSISAVVKTRKRKQTFTWRVINGVETRISLTSEGEQIDPPLHTSALHRPLPAAKPQKTGKASKSKVRSTSLPAAAKPQSSSSKVPSQPLCPPGIAPLAIRHQNIQTNDIDAGFRATDHYISKAQQQQALARAETPQSLLLPPLNPQPPQQAPAKPKPAPLEPKVTSPGPKVEISSNVGSPTAVMSRPPPKNPFFFSDPLAGWLWYPPAWQNQGYAGGQDRERVQGQNQGQHTQSRGAHAGPARGNGQLPNRYHCQQQPQYHCQAAQQNLQNGNGHRVPAQGQSQGQQPAGPQQHWTHQPSIPSPDRARGHQQRGSESGASSTGGWCPDEQLRQEAALMLSALRGGGLGAGVSA